MQKYDIVIIFFNLTMMKLKNVIVEIVDNSCFNTPNSIIIRDADGEQISEIRATSIDHCGEMAIEPDHAFYAGKKVFKISIKPYIVT